MSTTTYNEQRSLVEVETVGSLVEAGLGVAVLVLAIIGLARADSGLVTSIACIILGAALLAQGGAVAAEYSKLLSTITGGTLGAVELGTGMTSEMIAGGAAIVLGILGLLGLSAEILLSSAVIVAGATLVLAATTSHRLNTLKLQAVELPEMAQRVAQGAVSGAIMAQVLAGGAAIVLGILALTVTAHAMTLALVGFLVLGASMAVSGSAFTGRFLRLFHAERS
jgi:hypothetical protein